MTDPATAPQWRHATFTGATQGDLNIGPDPEIGLPPMEAAAQRARNALDRHIEREITEALTRALGDSWTPESLAGRTSRVAPPNSPETTYFLDGRPLLKIGVPQFSQVDNHLHYALPVQRYEWSPE